MKRLLSYFILGVMIATSLTACGSAATPSTTAPTQPALASAEEQLAQIDAILKQTLQANIAYNTPESMQLDQTVTIELRLSPTLSQQDLSTQVAESVPTQESGKVVSASIEVTPRMRALLLANDGSAFEIKAIHDNPEQLVSNTDVTQWDWLVTAQKGGTQRLTLVIYRLVRYDGQDYWREVETYQADINVKVSMSQRVLSLDWAWILGVLFTAIAIPAFWRWMDQRKKKAEQIKDDPTSQSKRKKK